MSWYAQMSAEIKSLIRRFRSGNPSNQFEEILFEAVGASISLAAVAIRTRMVRYVL